MGFGRKLIDWMKWCISTASFSMLINGTPIGFFKSSRFLCQGDPLSPFLFMLVVEAFSQLIKRAVRGGFLTAFHLEGRGAKGVELSHLLFAYDTLIFCEAIDDLSLLASDVI